MIYTSQLAHINAQVLMSKDAILACPLVVPRAVPKVRSETGFLLCRRIGPQRKVRPPCWRRGGTAPWCCGFSPRMALEPWKAVARDMSFKSAWTTSTPRKAMNRAASLEGFRVTARMLHSSDRFLGRWSRASITYNGHKFLGRHFQQSCGVLYGMRAGEKGLSG